MVDTWKKYLELEPPSALRALCNTLYQSLEQFASASPKDQKIWHKQLVELSIYLGVLLEKMGKSAKRPNFTFNLRDDITLAKNFANQVSEILNVIEQQIAQENFVDFVFRAQEEANLLIHHIVSYSFSEDEQAKVNELIAELRKLISSAEFIEEEHRRRLLVRLERLQSEVHKKVSDLDRFWGLVGDAGVVMRKFGEDAKPIVDRIKEIFDIVWRAQSQAEKLPKGNEFPLLGKPHDD